VEIVQLIIDNPVTVSLLTAAGPGVFLVWKALVGAAIRRINSSFQDDGVCALPEQAQRDHVTNSVSRQSMLPRGVIETQVRKAQSERPPKF